MESDSEFLVFNGIDCVTGRYLQAPIPARQLVGRLFGRESPEKQDEDLSADLQWRRASEVESHLAVVDGIDVSDLAESGWGVIFHATADPGIREAMGELLSHREALAGGTYETGGRYRAFVGPQGYLPGMSKNKFLIRNKGSLGYVDPRKMPYYLLIVGSPQDIPYRFQYALDVQHAVGRIHFEKPDGSPDFDAYASYSRSVVQAETSVGQRPRRAAFVGIRTPGDRATTLSADDLVSPLSDFLGSLKQSKAAGNGWDVSTMIGPDQATKERLKQHLGGSATPGLLFWAGHGASFPNGHPLQLSDQGAMICQEWPLGTLGPDGTVPREFYLCADDIPDDANLSGLIAFQFACYGAGTPQYDEYAHHSFDAPKEIAPRSFVARLPQRLLGHPRGGALAVVGHVERAWTCSFRWGNQQALTSFELMLSRLLEGKPVGFAMEPFNGKYAEAATDLAAMLEEYRLENFEDLPHLEIANLYLNQNDARAYAIIGDPAVRLVTEGSIAPSAGSNLLR
jgi:hypothetical protein